MRADLMIVRTPIHMRILYIEDQTAEGEVIVRLLDQVFQRVFRGRSEFKVVKTIGEADGLVIKDYDVVLLDLTLPDSSTDNTVDKVILSRVPNWPPVFVLTGHEEREAELRDKCFANGAGDFMLKLNAHRHPEELCERVYGCILRRKYERRAS
jgi:CheY-like chemotaxis protein